MQIGGGNTISWRLVAKVFTLVSHFCVLLPTTLSFPLPPFSLLLNPSLSLSGGPRSILPPLQPGQKLLHVVEGWLRKERDTREQKQQEQAAARAASGQQQEQTPVVPTRTPMMPNKHLAFFR